MKDESVTLPEEIEKFTISREHLEKILQERLKTRIESLEIEDGKAKIKTPTTLLEDTATNRYNRNVNNINLNKNKVELDLGGPRRTNQEETDDTTESGRTELKSSAERTKEKNSEEAENKDTKTEEEGSEKEETWRGESVDSSLAKEGSKEYDDMNRLERLRRVMRGEN